MLIGPTIKKLRLARGMTQPELEHAAGISAGNISRLERDEQSYSSTSINGIATALKVPVYLLFTQGEDIPAQIPLTDEQVDWLSIFSGLTKSQRECFYIQIISQKKQNDLILQELS